MPDRRLAAAVPVVVMVVVGLVAAGGRFGGGDNGGLAFALMVVLVLGSLAFGWWYSLQRQKALQQWAARNGWTYYGTDQSLVSRWRGTPFGHGSSRRVSELVVGRWGGLPAMSFAYRYTTGSGKNRTTHHYWVCAVSMPTWLPTLQLTPQGFGARIVTALGGQDIEFESEDFNRAWRVEARDAKFAHDILHPRMLERLVRGDARGLSLRMEGADVLCWSQELPDLDRLAARLGVMRAMVDGVPRYVWLDHGYDPEQIRTDLGEPWTP
ncbi:hypothetical protein OEB99_13660 [Actinotalea sp. M2MS4P-6]|uniref:hypothetical protein n=1 Tax=Actinotalea sp. M2MS4P-6 TaxID=2983762 RepID=UPI0021E49C9D|nr:hypothetical protein [Actinotalea sp. M2MS4P-6]MCV2395358.1 hypothetical protein [Actinotalea sp. M2MS4P-6]